MESFENKNAGVVTDLVIMGLQKDLWRYDYARGLLKNGIDVLVVRDELEFLAAIRNFTPDLAVVDMELDDLGAFVIMKVLRSHPTRGNIPIIATGSHWLDESIAMDAGADHFLAKPFEHGELEAKVGERLAMFEAARAPEKSAVDVPA